MSLGPHIISGKLAVTALWVLSCSEAEDRPPPLEDPELPEGEGSGEPCGRTDVPTDIFNQTGSLSDAEYWSCERPKVSSDRPRIVDVEGTSATVTSSTVDYRISWQGPESLQGHNLIMYYGPGDGYFVIPIRKPSNVGGSAELLEGLPDANPLEVRLVVQRDAPAGPVDIHFGLTDDSRVRRADPEVPRVSPHLIGNIEMKELEIIAVGSGDVQVNLHWDTLVDLDLHLVEPGGEIIGWDNPLSATGGELDLDSYAVCMFNDRGRGNENVFWPQDKAPVGEYRVIVDMFSDCGTFVESQPTDFRATVILDGDDVRVFEGRFEAGDPTAVEIATFTY